MALRRVLAALALIGLIVSSTATCTSNCTFKERALKLVAQMTLDEKVSQLGSNSPAIQRLGVSPFNWWQECLHGAADFRTFQRGGTIFPQPLGLAATFDVDLMEQVASAISDEMRAKDNLQFASSGAHEMTSCFGPSIDIFRDPRWGRGSEAYGEDPQLSALMGQAFVRGLQGNDSKFIKVGATCKHFLAYDMELWGGVSRFTFNAELDPRDMEDTFLPPFRACVGATGNPEGATSVMCSYNALNGVPSCANKWLLEEQLRGKMGFEGYVVSDCFALEALVDRHHIANDSAAAAAAALEAGVDLACMDYSGLLAAVKQKLVKEKEVDVAVARVLNTRLKLGHFDPHASNPYSKISPSVLGGPQNMALAKEAARKSVVLLKNEQDAGSGKPTLPLDAKALKKISVIGPMANRTEYLLGSYYGHSWGDITSPLDAIQAYILQASKGPVSSQSVSKTVTPPAKIDYLIGTEVVGSAANVEGTVESCMDADVCIFFVGTTTLAGDYTPKERVGSYPMMTPVIEAEGQDRDSLVLPGTQLDLIQATAQRTNASIVVVLIHGGPLDVEWLQNSPRVGAILTAWYPGQGAVAIADALFGKFSPSGRLPVTFYFDNYTSQVDMLDMRMRPWPGRTYRFVKVPVLYPFGHGLSYTTFTYSDLAVTAAGGGAVRVSVTVANTGDMAGEEVVLVFLSYQHGDESPDVPNQTLAAFKRIALAAGSNSTVVLRLSAADFAAASSGAEEIGAGAACGLYSVRVGPLSQDVHSCGEEVVSSAGARFGSWAAAAVLATAVAVLVLGL